MRNIQPGKSAGAKVNRFRGGMVGCSFGLSDALGWAVVPLKEAAFSATRLKREVPDGECVKVRISPERSYFLMLYLRDVMHCDLDADGNRGGVKEFRKGSICLVSLTAGASICLESSLDAVAFVLPTSLFDELVERYPEHEFQELHILRGAQDDVMRNLGNALLPFFEKENVSAPLESIAIAICAHLIDNYAVLKPRRRQSTSSLSAWQEKMAKQFMAENMAHDISLAAIAEFAGVKAEEFSKKFKRASGATPQGWMRHIRIEKSKMLLSQHSLQLSEIAKECGFADVDDLSASFLLEVGVTTSKWLTQTLH